MPVRAVIFDFYGTLAESPQWGPSWQDMVTEAVGVPEATRELLIERARDIGAHRHIVAYDEVLGVLTELRSRNVALAICSNWDWDLAEAVEAAGLTDAVDVMCSSAWVGARKPHPRMYAAVLDLVEVAPADALFVGDTWTCDVDGPRAAGFQPLYLRRSHLGTDKTAPADHHAQDVRRGDDLRAVLDLAILS